MRMLNYAYSFALCRPHIRQYNDIEVVWYPKFVIIILEIINENDNLFICQTWLLRNWRKKAIMGPSKNIFGRFGYPHNSPSWIFDPDLPNFYLPLSCNIRIRDPLLGLPLPQKIFRGLLWMTPINKLNLSSKKCTVWFYYSIISMPNSEVPILFR